MLAEAICVPSGLNATAQDRVGVPSESDDLLIRLHIPDLHGLITAGRGDPGPIGAEREAPYGAGVALEDR